MVIAILLLVTLIVIVIFDITLFYRLLKHIERDVQTLDEFTSHSRGRISVLESEIDRLKKIMTPLTNEYGFPIPDHSSQIVSPANTNTWTYTLSTEPERLVRKRVSKKKVTKTKKVTKRSKKK